MPILDIIGQEQAIGRLERARRMERVPHGYIFSGPEGVGKATLATQWARLQFCSSPVTRPVDPGHYQCDSIRDACGECKDCHLVQSQTHPDLHFIDRDLGRFTSGTARSRQLLTLPIDVIREFVIEPAGGFPTRGRAKVFIIDEAHTMARPAQNALLKTLEEPPPGTFLILCTSRADLLLKTIHSRTQIVRFKTLPNEFVLAQLQSRNIPNEQALFWTHFCNGRLGIALTLAQLDFFDQMQALLNALASLGYRNMLDVAQLMVDSAKHFSQEYLKHNSKHSASDATRMGYQLFIQLYCWAFQMAIYSHSGWNSAEMPSGKPIAVLARKYDPLMCARAIQISARTESALTTNANPSLLFESLLLDYIELQMGS